MKDKELNFINIVYFDTRGQAAQMEQLFKNKVKHYPKFRYRLETELKFIEENNVESFNELVYECLADMLTISIRNNNIINMVNVVNNYTSDGDGRKKNNVGKSNDLIVDFLVVIIF
eukprot:Pgem_evm2s391